jgi:hypothetical protein
MENQVQSFAAIAGLIITLTVFTLQQRSANKARIRDTYLKLELSSNEIFRFEAANAVALALYIEEAPPTGERRSDDDLLAENFYLQQLNLFEVSVRFRQTNIMEKSVFGSWVSWYYEVLTSWFFREKWPGLRAHYTPELRDIFDGPVASFGAFADEEARRREFFRHVGKLMRCKVIRDWLNDDRAGKSVGKKGHG